MFYFLSFLIFNGLVYYFFIKKTLKEAQEYKAKNIFNELVFEKNNVSEILINLNTNTVIDCNDVILRFLEIQRKDVIGKTPPDLSPKYQLDGRLSSEKTLEMTRLAIEKGSHTFEWINITKSLKEIYSEVTLTPMTYKGKEVLHVASKMIDDKIALQKEVATQTQILQQVQDSIVSTNKNGFITTWNSGAENMFKYTSNEMIGKHISLLNRKEDKSRNRTLVQQLVDVNHQVLELYLTKKDKEIIICETSISVLKDTQKKVVGFISVIKDITLSKAHEKKLIEQKNHLSYLANHDSLTGLHNRMYLTNKLLDIDTFTESSTEEYALLFIDSDRFKEINDSLGHLIGDELLKNVAKRLQKVITPNDILSRFGGDEFAILIHSQNQDNAKQASVLAQKILNTLSKPFYIDENTLYISSSIGISLYQSDEDDSSKLLMYADTAMYKAKEMGRNNFQFYSSNMTELAVKQITLVTNLKEALNNNEFIVYYQIQMDAKAEKVIGMEALIRWEHPELGMIRPDEFIPMAEELGLIVEIDRWVMLQAMHDVKGWYDAGLNPGVLALNLAMKQLHKEDFFDFLQNSLQTTNFRNSWLELEITEGHIMQNPEGSIKILHQVSDIGIEIAIDDFGTGYSSLSYLKKLPVDKLKIDQSFVRSLPSDDEDVAIAKAVIALAKSLNLRVIAEGVETVEQKEFLVENGCNNIQGYYYSKPIPADQIFALLNSYED